eukprot:scaffold41680_cov30-Tisochrysis_lutea.AAC.1
MPGRLAPTVIASAEPRPTKAPARSDWITVLVVGMVAWRTPVATSAWYASGGVLSTPPRRRSTGIGAACIAEAAATKRESAMRRGIASGGERVAGQSLLSPALSPLFPRPTLPLLYNPTSTSKKVFLPLRKTSLLSHLFHEAVPV